MKYKTIKVPIYPCYFTVAETQNAEEFSTRFNLDVDYEPYASTLHGSIKRGGRQRNCVFILLNRSNEHSPLSLSVIAHECFHASQMVFDIIGQEAGEGREEPQAYLIDWFFEECMNFLGIEDDMPAKPINS